MNLDKEYEVYMECLVNKVDLQYRRLGLYNLGSIGRENQWQVHCDDTRYKVSQIFFSMRLAVEKFIELKYKLDKSYGRIKK